MAKTTTIYHRDGRERTVDVHEASRLVGAGTIGAGAEWSLHKPPPEGWEREIPKYRAVKDLRPAQKDRYRFEPPFGTMFDSDIWQYASKSVKTGEIVETKEWPHPSFIPLNFAATMVLEFFKSRIKSRLPRTPWLVDRIHLDDGLTGPSVVNPTLPKYTPMDLRPVS